MPECTVKGVPSHLAQPQRHPNSKCASSPLWMAMHQKWSIFNGGLQYYFIYQRFSHKLKFSRGLMALATLSCPLLCSGHSPSSILTIYGLIVNNTINCH